MLKRIFLMAMLAAGPASATQEYLLPTLFDVGGVAPDDVLNIRERPSAASEIIGELDPDATGIEVVATDSSGSWGLINVDEGSGWVAMHFLRYRTDVWTEGALPAQLSCGGTEPFWSLVPGGSGLRWRAPDSMRVYSRLEVLSSGVFRSPRRALIAQSGDGQRLSAVIVPKACNDGMSDRSYGLDITVMIEGTPSQIYTGCCQIAAAR